MTILRGKIAAVSYLNSIPFIYGIEHANILRDSLLLSPPSQCVSNYLNGAADIALVPVAAIPDLKDAEIITPYCIGARGSVRTVVLMSNDPLEAIERIYLDNHSITSACLTQILSRDLWNISPQRIQMNDYSIVNAPLKGDAFLLIGDKVFGYEGRFDYCYDLADCWRDLTGLPFVFAAWVARKGVSEKSIEMLEAALGYGVEHIADSIKYYGHGNKEYAFEYLTENIDFIFDKQKQQALSLFWDKGMKQPPRANPG